uniref:Uncharacterized protein n=1 Tax=Anser cygnoides TaxID=8845 RepID=A0A8B9DEE2_ANSCY
MPGMLPGAGVYYFPWEINSSVPEGEALRTFGRLCCYNLARSEAILSAQHSAAQHHVCVDTRLVEPFETDAVWLLRAAQCQPPAFGSQKSRGKPITELTCIRVCGGIQPDLSPARSWVMVIWPPGAICC